MLYLVVILLVIAVLYIVYNNQRIHKERYRLIIIQDYAPLAFQVALEFSKRDNDFSYDGIREKYLIVLNKVAEGHKFNLESIYLEHAEVLLKALSDSIEFEEN